jgi:hypothetical protein
VISLSCQPVELFLDKAPWIEIVLRIAIVLFPEKLLTWKRKWVFENLQALMKRQFIGHNYNFNKSIFVCNGTGNISESVKMGMSPITSGDLVGGCRTIGGLSPSHCLWDAPTLGLVVFSAGMWPKEHFFSPQYFFSLAKFLGEECLLN